VAVLRNTLPPGVEVGAYANGFATSTSAWLSGGRGAEGEDEGEGGRGAARCTPGEAGAAGAASPDPAGTATITPDAYAAAVLDWIDAGATIVGGCCGVGPAHMAAVAAAVSSKQQGRRGA
jgi:hypothetical protein